MAVQPVSDADLDALLASAAGLEALEGILDASVAHEVLGKALSPKTPGEEVDLASLLVDSETELHGATETFVEAHCGKLDDICRLYREVSVCEAQLRAFEEDISSFQGSLTSTADDIVRMQTRTVEVVHRIDNRKAVSEKLKEVYEALNECDVFCEHIANASTVDDAFLKSIRQLESRISFLADNAELEDSEVRADFYPKLEAAADRAGDKLHRFILKKLETLSEENCNVALHQQGIERQGCYAYAFLSRYNEPIAQDIVNQYVKLMADVYLRQTKPIEKELFQIGQMSGGAGGKGHQHAEPLSLIPADLVVSMGGHRRQPSLPPMQQSAARPSVTIAEPDHDSAVAKMRKGSRSVSMSLGLAFDKFRGKVPDRRDATFADNIHALRAVDVTYRLVTVDPTVAIKLEGTTCWVHRFSELYCKLVNNVINEGRFVDHFFFSVGATTEQEEALLHCILDRQLYTAMQIILAEVPKINDTIGLLCAKRALELFKNFVTQSADPLPIMVMADLFDRIGSAFSSRLDDLLKYSAGSLDDIVSIKGFKEFPALSAEAARMPFAEVVSHDNVLAERLAAHDVVRRYADITGQLHIANTMVMEGSRVGIGFERTYFDDAVNLFLSNTLDKMLHVVGRLAARHPSPLSAAVFEVNNLGFLALEMVHAEESHISTVVGGIASPLSGSGANPPSPGRDGRQSPRSPGTMSTASTGEGGGLTAQQAQGLSGFAAPVPKITNVIGTPQYAALLAKLKEATVKFVHLDVCANNAIAPFTDCVERLTKEFGEDFFKAPQAGQPTPGSVDAPAGAPSEAELVGVLSGFQKGWQAAVTKVAEHVKTLFPMRRGELAVFVLREYFGQIVIANTRMRWVVERAYSKSTVLRGKLVGGVVITHEVAKYLNAATAARGD